MLLVANGTCRSLTSASTFRSPPPPESGEPGFCVCRRLRLLDAASLAWMMRESGTPSLVSENLKSFSPSYQGNRSPTGFTVTMERRQRLTTAPHLKESRETEASDQSKHPLRPCSRNCFPAVCELTQPSPSSSRLGSWRPRPQQEQLVMCCSSRLERVPHGSDLRLRSQDGKSKKEEAPTLLASQPAYWWPGIQMPAKISWTEQWQLDQLS
uniref:uncharacterized protein LOC118530642 isoform X2 n=1 Tax=Halichoerus grypus TaxID=9711 RepID=UPI001659778A|nr:uncharacterized protein LOC118530642 isoform X2 [Halichoerus grypus]